MDERPAPKPSPEPAASGNDAEAGTGRKGRRGLFGRRKEAADVVDRWWAGEDDGEDPFGRPPARDQDDSVPRPRVPGQR